MPGVTSSELGGALLMVSSVTAPHGLAAAFGEPAAALLRSGFLSRDASPCGLVKGLG